MRELVILLEEESAQAMLEGLLPRLMPEGIHLRCIPFQGKQDLEKQMVKRMRGPSVREAFEGYRRREVFPRRAVFRHRGPIFLDEGDYILTITTINQN